MRFEKEAEFVAETAAQRWRPRLMVFGAVLIMLAGAGGWWLWSRQHAAVQTKATQQAAIAAAEVQLAAARAAADENGVASAELVGRLEALAIVQRRLADLRPENFAAQLEEVRRTEARLSKLRAQIAQQRSEAEEVTAHEQVAAGNGEGGAAHLRAALKWQRELNAGAPDGSRNFDRELRLQRELAELTAEPMLEAVTAKTAQANAALAAAQWEDALRLFREARELQDRLNREFPRTRYSDLAAIARFDAEIASLTADGLDAQVNEHMQRARELRTGGRTDEAAKELVEAAAAQRQLNERFGRSRFVSMERLDQIETERQTALAEEPLRSVHAKREEARRFLRRRQIFRAQQSVREGYEAMEDLRARFPKARQNDDDLRTEFAFLNLRASDLAALQDRIYEQLGPLGEGPRAMTKTEVRQADFAKVMNANPSRNPGRALPVDSVTYPEAEEFCRRLGWVLGWRVRLPTADEMRMLPVAGGEQGFQNVNSGLAEWLATAGGRDNANAAVWTGAGEITEAPRSERVRTRGFRMVVEVDLARLGEE